MSDHTPPRLLDTATWDALKAAGFSDEELYADQPCGPLIYQYTRQQAIEDGVLIDLAQPGLARLLSMVGIRIHAAMTATAFGTCVAPHLTPAHAEQTVANLLRLLLCFRQAIDRATDRNTDRVYFDAPGLDGQTVALWAIVGPGDEGEPVLTFMLIGED